MLNAKGIIGLVLPIGAVCISVSVQAMTARAMLGKEVVVENGKQFLQTKVSCTDSTVHRMIISQDAETGEDDPWCSKDVRSFCADSRIEAAILVCSSEYRSAVAAQSEKQQLRGQPSSDAKVVRSSLLAERLAIEKKLLEIGQRKLSLLNRELDLQNREAQLNQRSGN